MQEVLTKDLVWNKQDTDNCLPQWRGETQLARRQRGFSSYVFWARG